MIPAKPCLRARGLVFRIGAAAIVDRLDLDLAPGTVMGLIGPNGAGKTTAIDLLSGFRLPHAGLVELGDKDLTRLSPDRRVRYGLARTFQESPTIAGLTVWEHVQLAFHAAGRRRSGRRADSPGELLGRLGLDACRNLPAVGLPIAKRRLLDLARALATGPDVILLDEPFAGLSGEEEQILISELSALRDRGRSAIVVEHRLSLLRKVADGVLALVEGRPIASGRLEDVLADPRIQEAYLGNPHKEAAAGP